MVFADADSRLDGLLWLLQAELRGGTNAIAGQRLVCVYPPADALTDVPLLRLTIL